RSPPADQPGGTGPASPAPRRPRTGTAATRASTMERGGAAPLHQARAPGHPLTPLGNASARIGAAQIRRHTPQPRQPAPQRDQDTAKPDQRNERLPPQPQLPAAILRLITDHDIKLPVPAREQRAFRRLLRGRPETALLRPGLHGLPALVTGGNIALHRRPV